MMVRIVNPSEVRSWSVSTVEDHRIAVESRAEQS